MWFAEEVPALRTHRTLAFPAPAERNGVLSLKSQRETPRNQIGPGS
eukprot:SAG11_NODE_38164_length_253_cov_1.272727_1_plen_45_part_01